MKRHTLLKHLESHGCELLRKGEKHSTIYHNPVKRRTSAVPRPTEIANLLARKICTDIGISPPP